MNKLESIYNSLLNELGKTQLIAVTKTRPISDIEQLYRLGQRDFGENRVLDLIEKSQKLIKYNDIRWHMIGSLQRNKIKSLLKINNLVAIHSVSSLKMIEELNKYDLGKIKIFLQMNTSDETEKDGFKSLSELKKASETLHAPIFGLMTMGKIRTDNFKEDALHSFKKLQQTRDNLNKTLKLSMGMSQDYTLALQLGTDFVRVGSKLFL